MTPKCQSQCTKDELVNASVRVKILCSFQNAYPEDETEEREAENEDFCSGGASVKVCKNIDCAFK